ncbi:MAG TPA: DNA (cytosine-5-)-methyltransferase [Betaproteobacteria bacterium]|nr:DNA (cytosine-5-)-methyltransferase [Betaproteobacteria bacterium]
MFDPPHLDSIAPAGAIGSRKPSARPGPKTQPPRRRFFEFFAGSGLVTQGFKGIFDPVWANDVCKKKTAVYTANHGETHFSHGPIERVNGADLPQAPLAWASFPCQDISLAGLVEGIHATRSGLVWEWLRVIDEMPKRPTVLVAENVAGLVSLNEGAHYRALHQSLVERGYHVGAMLINADRWVPQSRQRVFVVAIDARSLLPLSLTSSSYNWLHPVSVRRAAHGLPGWIWWSMPQPPKRQSSLADIVEWNAETQDPKAQQRNLSLISPRHASTLESLPANERLAVPGYKRTRNGKQVLELRFDNIAGCLRTPEGGSSRQLLVLRQNGGLRCRLLTVRETARLMGAPDTYKIPGSYNDGYKAMGDGVAVPVARWLAKHLLSPLVKTNA